MTIVVVDASALAAVAFQEPEAQATRDRLEGQSLAAPRLLAYELANVALVKLRRHPEQAATIHAGLAAVLADDFELYWSDVDHAAVVDLARQTALTAYDAAYVWLARHLDAELVTLDADLARADRRLAGR
jgi:predicted nucleic acid-binding protein